MIRNLIPFDVETTTILTGTPYHIDNRLVAIGLGDYLWYKNFTLEYIQIDVDKNILVGHNIKFDIAWLKRIGINFSKAIIRDTQLAEFLISNQTHAFASLNALAHKYLNEEKLDVVKLEYWDKGIDTWWIPKDILLSYLQQDLDLTIKIYKIQEKILKQENKWNLYLLLCADLLELSDMEYNGILYNKKESISKGKELEKTINAYKELISNYSNCPSFNCNSGDHTSCLLYGGTILHTNHVLAGIYKTGKKIGQPRYKREVIEYKQEQLVEPLKGSALKKEGYYSVDDATLASLKAKGQVKELISAIRNISKLEKLVGTYYYGIPKLMEEQEWREYLHGQFNQCVARTGRLSSSKPNLQNMDPLVKQLCISRYDNKL